MILVIIDSSVSYILKISVSAHHSHIHTYI